MTISPSVTAKKLKIGQLRKVHHIAFNAKDMDASRHFYGEILGGPADEFPANFFYFFVSRPKTVKTDSAKNLKKSDRPRTD